MPNKNLFYTQSIYESNISQSQMAESESNSMKVETNEY